MSQFVDECRKEWRQLGVPEAEANEMASDLDADLAEAEADGVAPEAVLGNGYFDPRAFAASWADARGVVDLGPRTRQSRHLPIWALVVGAGVGAVVALLGLAVLVGRHSASESVAAAHFKPQFANRPPIGGLFVGPHPAVVARAGIAFAAVGGLLFLVGLVGVGVMLWLYLRRSNRGRGSGPDPDIGMPSFL